MGSLSRVFCYRGDFEKALEYAHFYLKVSQVLSNKFREIPALADVFMAQLYSGAYLEAEKTIQLRRSFVENLERNEDTLETYYLMGLLDMFKEEFHSAVQWLEFSIRFAEENHLKIDLLYYSILGVLYLLIDNRTEAENCLAKAEDLTAVHTGHGGDIIEKLVFLACTHADPILASGVMVLAGRFHRG